MAAAPHIFVSALVVAFFVFFFAFSATEAVSIGDRLYRDYTVYDAVPTTMQEAKEAGWTIHNGCDPHRGYRATFTASGPTKSTPMTLFFTEAGQVAGVGVNVYGKVKQNLVDQGYFEEVGNEVHFVAVSFRNSSMMCSGRQSGDVLGDTLIVNAGNLSHHLPLTESAAVSQKWTKGSCFYSMGYHYFYDLASAPEMSWEAANLLPIVMMYNNGQLNAFFFASSVVQQGLLSSNWWEPIPLINTLMCKNWCDSSCTFHDTLAWSTLHIYLKDYTQATCSGGCKISCCP